MQYRIQSTGQVKTQGEVRRMHPNVSLPKVWDTSVCSNLGIDPILESPKPSVEQYTHAVRDGVVQDDLGNWVWSWKIVDMFEEYTDIDGITHTKETQETTYQQEQDDKSALSVRKQRDLLLEKTDWTALSDVNMSEEMRLYRQALRDITNHDSFPYLTESDWPIKP